jgi:hypothetical protein
MIETNGVRFWPQCHFIPDLRGGELLVVTRRLRSCSIAAA